MKKIKDGDNIEDVKQKTDALSASLQKIGAELYKNAAEQTKQENAGEQGRKDDKDQKAEEGEYKEQS